MFLTSFYRQTPSGDWKHIGNVWGLQYKIHHRGEELIANGKTVARIVWDHAVIGASRVKTLYTNLPARYL